MAEFLWFLKGGNPTEIQGSFCPKELMHVLNVYFFSTLDAFGAAQLICAGQSCRRVRCLQRWDGRDSRRELRLQQGAPKTQHVKALGRKNGIM